MIECPPIFDFDDHVAFLQSCQLFDSHRRDRSLKLLATALGYDSPRPLAMAIKGQRLPSRKMIVKLSEYLGLTEPEQVYFECLVLLEAQKRQGGDTAVLRQRLARLRRKPIAAQAVEERRFAPIANWYFSPIRELAAMPGFRDDPAWISGRLGGSVTQQQVVFALQVLEEQGFLRRDEAGRLVECETHVVTTQDVPSRYNKVYHQQMLQRAKQALDEHGVDEREFQALTFAVAPEKLPAVKKRIRSFLEDLTRDFYERSGPEVFQLNMQFFSHTGKGAERD